MVRLRLTVNIGQVEARIHKSVYLAKINLNVLILGNFELVRHTYKFACVVKVCAGYKRVVCVVIVIIGCVDTAADDIRADIIRRAGLNRRLGGSCVIRCSVCIICYIVTHLVGYTVTP